MKHWFSAVLLVWATASSAAPPEWVRAEVVKVEPQRSRVVLKHAPIKSIGMEAMTMPFKTDPRVDLARFKAGDKVRFTLLNTDDHLIVHAMEKAR